MVKITLSQANVEHFLFLPTALLLQFENKFTKENTTQDDH